MKLIVGLGNPGTAYSDNRHNVGFMSVAHFAKVHGMRFDKRKGNARVAEGEIAGTAVVLARPQTYMNASGQAVNPLLRKLKLVPDDLVVIHDDLDLPLGRIRVRRGGSSGGHKGVQSIIGDVGTADFVRIRIGIGRPGGVEGREQNENHIVDYVLSGFTPDERFVIKQTIAEATDVLEHLIARGLTETMNKFNASSPEKSVAAKPDLAPGV